MTDPLDEQLRQKLEQTGSISSADIQNAAPDPQSEAADAFEASRKEPSKIDSDEKIQLTEEEKEGRSYSERQTADNFLRQMQQVPDYLRALFDPDTKIEVEVSPADKENYYDALINNTRFTRQYRLLDGKLTFTLQSLTELELRAYWTQYVHESARAGITAYEHRSRSRDLLLALAVCEYRGEAIKPVTPADLNAELTVTDDGKTSRETPKWVERTKLWEAQNPGLLALMFKAYREFEFLYWRIVAETRVENF